MTQPVSASSAGWWDRTRVLRLVLAVVLAIVAVGMFFANRSSASATNDITLQGADTPGTNTFAPSIASPAPAPSTATTMPPPSTSGLTKATGDTPGLYAGERGSTNCNVQALITYLEANPDRARAWAAPLEIAAGDIRAFIESLTPVVARVDTRVTDYGFGGGRAIPRQMIIQAGTDILVDRTGMPRVRCASGNPLGPPRSVTGTPSYDGTRWRGFSPATVIIVAPAPAPVIFVLIDLRDPLLVFVRLPGAIVIIDIDRPGAGVPLIVLEVGQRARLTGANWPPGTVVTVTLDNPAVTLATVTADGGGNIAADVTIPLTTRPGPHVVTFTGGGFTVTQTVYVIPPAPGRGPVL